MRFVIKIVARVSEFHYLEAIGSHGIPVLGLHSQSARGGIAHLVDIEVTRLPVRGATAVSLDEAVQPVVDVFVRVFAAKATNRGGSVVQTSDVAHFVESVVNVLHGMAVAVAAFQIVQTLQGVV